LLRDGKPLLMPGGTDRVVDRRPGTGGCGAGGAGSIPVRLRQSPSNEGIPGAAAEFDGPGALRGALGER
jgi:hypothetical protein